MKYPSFAFSAVCILDAGYNVTLSRLLFFFFGFFFTAFYTTIVLAFDWIQPRLLLDSAEWVFIKPTNTKKGRTMDIPLVPGEDRSKLTALLTKLTDSESPSHEATDDGWDLSEFLTFADSAEGSVLGEHVCRRIVCHAEPSDIGGNSNVVCLIGQTPRLTSGL